MQYLEPPLPLNEVNIVAKQLEKRITPTGAATRLITRTVIKSSARHANTA